jgi:hypothetical protein
VSTIPIAIGTTTRALFYFVYHPDGCRDYHQSFKKNPPPVGKRIIRAEDRARTGHPDLGKVVLYQMSYFRVFIEIDKELKGGKNKALAFFEKNIFNLLFILWSI